MLKKLSFISKYGWITGTEIEGKIVSINFSKKKSIGQSKILAKLKKDINIYFLKKSKLINTKVLLNGSKLQIKIWKELRKIPYGKTKSYKQIANILNTSPRYVGRVCGQNNHLLVVPCHRVIKSDGKLGGFSGKGGIALKKKLLYFEQANK